MQRIDVKVNRANQLKDCLAELAEDENLENGGRLFVSLARNALENLPSFHEEVLHPFRNIWFLDLSGNCLANLDAVAQFTALGYLNISQNSLSEEAAFVLSNTHICELQFKLDRRHKRFALVCHLPHVWSINDVFVTAEERSRAQTYYRRSNFKSPTAAGAAPVVVAEEAAAAGAGAAEAEAEVEEAPVESHLFAKLDPSPMAKAFLEQVDRFEESPNLRMAFLLHLWNSRHRCQEGILKEARTGGTHTSSQTHKGRTNSISAGLVESSGGGRRSPRAHAATTPASRRIRPLSRDSSMAFPLQYLLRSSLSVQFVVFCALFCAYNRWVSEDVFLHLLHSLLDHLSLPAPAEPAQKPSAEPAPKALQCVHKSPSNKQSASVQASFREMMQRGDGVAAARLAITQRLLASKKVPTILDPSLSPEFHTQEERERTPLQPLPGALVADWIYQSALILPDHLVMAVIISLQASLLEHCPPAESLRSLSPNPQRQHPQPLIATQMNSVPNTVTVPPPEQQAEDNDSDEPERPPSPAVISGIRQVAQTVQKAHVRKRSPKRPQSARSLSPSPVTPGRNPEASPPRDAAVSVVSLQTNGIAPSTSPLHPHDCLRRLMQPLPEAAILRAPPKKSSHALIEKRPPSLFSLLRREGPKRKANKVRPHHLQKDFEDISALNATSAEENEDRGAPTFGYFGPITPEISYRCNPQCEVFSRCASCSFYERTVDALANPFEPVSFPLGRAAPLHPLQAALNRSLRAEEQAEGQEGARVRDSSASGSASDGTSAGGGSGPPRKRRSRHHQKRPKHLQLFRGVQGCYGFFALVRSLTISEQVAQDLLFEGHRDELGEFLPHFEVAKMTAGITSPQAPPGASGQTPTAPKSPSRMNTQHSPTYDSAQSPKFLQSSGRVDSSQGLLKSSAGEVPKSPSSNHLRTPSTSAKPEPIKIHNEANPQEGPTTSLITPGQRSARGVVLLSARRLSALSPLTSPGSPIDPSDPSALTLEQRAALREPLTRLHARVTTSICLATGLLQVACRVSPFAFTQLLKEAQYPVSATQRSVLSIPVARRAPLPSRISLSAAQLQTEEDTGLLEGPDLTGRKGDRDEGGVGEGGSDGLWESLAASGSASGEPFAASVVVNNTQSAEADSDARKAAPRVKKGVSFGNFHRQQITETVTSPPAERRANLSSANEKKKPRTDEEQHKAVLAVASFYKPLFSEPLEFDENGNEQREETKAVCSSMEKSAALGDALLVVLTDRVKGRRQEVAETLGTFVRRISVHVDILNPAGNHMVRITLASTVPQNIRSSAVASRHLILAAEEKEEKEMDENGEEKKSEDLWQCNLKDLQWNVGSAQWEYFLPVAESRRRPSAIQHVFRKKLDQKKLHQGHLSSSTAALNHSESHLGVHTNLGVSSDRSCVFCFPAGGKRQEKEEEGRPSAVFAGQSKKETGEKEKDRSKTGIGRDGAVSSLLLLEEWEGKLLVGEGSNSQEQEVEQIMRGNFQTPILGHDTGVQLQSPPSHMNTPRSGGGQGGDRGAGDSEQGDPSPDQEDDPPAYGEILKESQGTTAVWTFASKMRKSLATTLTQSGGQFFQDLEEEAQRRGRGEGTEDDDSSRVSGMEGGG
eukprot:Cvel_21972.t1-p1 / transcript=Cvel_21972.t1 / gene=Cvel_21972 / organism=Chromera_velia_CCMP2878 / gene_product=hypothetical protein / transcript_product=hypothetical protein / location=Cvel_scaffold2112:26593-32900(+) / protein_length=1608 / sequence_SO=supercontig / SO=protein_coding / is_pseudo=false